MVIAPEALRAGDRVAVVAPSSPFDRALVRVGMGWLARRQRVTFEPRLFDRRGYLAGDDDARLGELQRALDASDVRAVLAARGGYGLTRIVQRLSWSGFRASPKWVVGFSDVTALHLAVAGQGFQSLHAHNVAGLGRADATRRSDWVHALESPEATRRAQGSGTLVAGQAEGPLWGGNLTLLMAEAAAGRLHPPEGALVVIEDVTEAPYRVDRALTALVGGGHLDRASGIVVGDFTDCTPRRDGVTIADVLRACLAPLGIPIATGFHFGHDERNDPLHLGRSARLDATSSSLTYA